MNVVLVTRNLATVRFDMMCSDAGSGSCSWYALWIQIKIADL